MDRMKNNQKLWRMKIWIEKIMEKKLSENNRGLTLVELLIAMGITALVITMVIMFLSSGSKSYSYGKEEVDLQMEAQTVMNQIEDMVIGASWIESRWIHTPSVSLKGIILYHKDEISLIFLDSGVKKLYLKDGLTDTDITNLTSMTYTENENLMSTYVSDIIIATSAINMKQEKAVELQIKFINGSKEYEVVKNIIFRNELVEP